jgi:hypothetical protein
LKDISSLLYILKGLSLSLPHLLSSHHEVSSFSLPYASHHNIQPHTRPKVMGQMDWAKTNLSSLNLIFSSILSQQLKAD